MTTKIGDIYRHYQQVHLMTKGSQKLWDELFDQFDINNS